MSLVDMDQDNHTAMIVHTIQHEYAPTTIALSTYPYYKVKSTHDQKGSLTQPQESTIQSVKSPTHKQANIYIYIKHASYTMLSHRTRKYTRHCHTPRVWPIKVQDTIRSRALMTRKGRSHSHKSPSYKMYNHPHTSKQIYIYIYIKHASCTMLSHRMRK